MDLNEIERLAKAAQASFGNEDPAWYNGGWSEHAVSPAEVVALVSMSRLALTGDAIAALREIRRSIDRWRSMVDEAECADSNERDAIMDALDTEMGEVLHTKFYKHRWWMP